MNLEEELSKYAQRELTPIKNPNRGNSELIIQNIKQISRLLIATLNIEVSEVSLQRVSEKFENGFKILTNSSTKELVTAVEMLSINFEPFLKKIAYLRFYENNPDLWLGSKTHKGITKSTLGEIFRSEIFPNEKIEYSNLSSIKYPSELIDFKGIKQSIYDETRKIRNDIHNAIDYSNTNLIKYLNIIISAYLLAIEDNKQYLKNKLLPEYYELAKRVDNDELKRINKHYIILQGSESNESDLQSEELNYSSLLKSIENLEDDFQILDIDIENRVSIQNTESIINFVNKNKSFILIGKPGSGKTTTLKNVYFNISHDFLNCKDGVPFPIFIDANTYNLENTFFNLIQKEIPKSSVSEFINHYKLLVLIDGVNEINEYFKLNALAELRYLSNHYREIVFVITMRKNGYKSITNFATIELKQLSEYQIIEYLENRLGKKKGAELSVRIKNNKRIDPLAFNPLYLNMILKIFQIQNGNLPNNKGLLFKIFCDLILERESKVYKTNKTTKLNVLSSIAFYMRENGYFKRVSKEIARVQVQSTLNNLNANIGVNEIIQELIDNEFFEDLGDEIEFKHETYEEYFVSLELKRLFLTTKTISINYYEEKWFESIEMTLDLFSDEITREKYFYELLIGKKSMTPKKIDQLISFDINLNFLTACRIAYNIRLEYPIIYVNTVKYIYNYLAIWLHHKIKNIEFVSFELLLEAVAILSNISLFKKIFDTNDFIYYWLYNEEFDKQHLHKSEDYKNINSNFENYFHVFSNSLSDFSCFYFFFSKLNLEEKYIYSKSIYLGLTLFEKGILRIQETEKLLKAFEITKEVKLVSRIGLSDIDFFIANYPIKNKSFYNYILKTISFNQRSIGFLLEEIRNNNIAEPFFISIFTELLLQFKTTINALDVFDSLENNRKITYLDSFEIRKALYTIPFDIIQKYSFGIMLHESSLARVTQNSNISEIDNPDNFFYYSTIILSIYKKYKIDFTLHPDLINQKELETFYEKIISKDSDREFIKLLGLNYLNINLISEKEVFYIIGKWENLDYFDYKIFNFKSNKVFDLKYRLIEFEGAREFCTISNNYRIIRIKKHFFINELIMTGIIVEVSLKNNVGFIESSRKNINEEKDYCFPIQKNGFIPKIGIPVTFIPAINPSRNHQSFPSAYGIELNKSYQNIAKVCDFKKDENGMKLYLEDLKTKHNYIAFIKESKYHHLGIKEDPCEMIFYYFIINSNVSSREKLPVIKLFPINE